MQINESKKSKMPRWDALFVSAGVFLASSPALASDDESWNVDPQEVRQLTILEDFRSPRLPKDPVPNDPTIDDPFPKPRAEREDSFTFQ